MKPLLVLDLDETLWHGNIWGDDHWLELEQFDRSLRPYLKEFLETVGKHYSLMVWTAASPEWADHGMAQILEETGFDLRLVAEKIWYRDRCTEGTKKSFDPYDYRSGERITYKKFNKLYKANRSWNPGQIVCLDDNRDNYPDAYSNVVWIHPWYGDPHDLELLKLSEYLPQLATKPNFRDVEKRGWSSHLYSWEH